MPSSRIDNHLPAASAIVIGENSRIAGQLLTYAHGGRIQIGDDCFVGEHSRIWSAEFVTVGDRVLISHGVNIHDSNSHSISASSRHAHIRAVFTKGHPESLPDVSSAGIVIEDDAWIGFNAVVLKGVRIGRGAVVGAGSVVTADVPSFEIVAGNPARTVGRALP
jgi:acetyltransferase-like isoleucine patch superfamily enzyme